MGDDVSCRLGNLEKIIEFVAALGVKVGLGGFGGGGSVKNRLLAVENVISLITEEVRGGKGEEVRDRKTRSKRIFRPFVPETAGGMEPEKFTQFFTWSSMKMKILKFVPLK